MNPTDPISEIPNYAAWLTPDQVAAQVGASSVVVNAWIVTGIRIETGRLHLRAVKVGGRWKIEPAAVVEFITTSTNASLPASATRPADAPKPPKEETEAARKRRVEACMARLAARGIGIQRPERPARKATENEN